MLESLKQKLSILTCKYFFNGFEGTRRFETDGFSEQVYLFNADYTLGLFAEWKHIFMNQKLFGKELEGTQRQIFLHEKGHENTNMLLVTLGGLSQLFIYTGAPLIIFLTVAALLAEEVINSGIPVLTTQELLSPLYIVAALYPLAIITSYISETKADLFSLKYMTTEEFRKAKKAYKEIQPLTRKRLFLIRLTHPSTKFVLRTHRIISCRYP